MCKFLNHFNAFHRVRGLPVVRKNLVLRDKEISGKFITK